MSIEEYKKMLEIKRKNEIKKLPLLYVLFCLLLKIDPLPAKMDFGKARVKITKEMRIEIKYMSELSRQLNANIQNCYKIEKRNILWQQEYEKAMKKEQERQKQNELKQSKKKSRKYLR